MTKPAVRLILNEAIIERVHHDVTNNVDVEIGGRWIGHVYYPGEQPKESNFEVSEDQMTYVIYGYLPTGPNPERSTAVELMPDNHKELCARIGVRINHPHYVCANALEYDYSFGEAIGVEKYFNF